MVGTCRQQEMYAFVLRKLGRIRSHRTAGSKLGFIDLVQNSSKVQIVYNQGSSLHNAGKQLEKFKGNVRRGDIYGMCRSGSVSQGYDTKTVPAITGKPYRTRRGELSIEATEAPKLLAPCLHSIPVDPEGHEDSPYDRHVQLLAHRKSEFLIRCRSDIIQCMRQFLLDRGFLEVNTPILASDAGGAIAKPFRTSATEFPERQISLRIAPELWLKRLVVGGLEKVFEIGPSFRNEGQSLAQQCWLLPCF